MDEVYQALNQQIADEFAESDWAAWGEVIGAATLAPIRVLAPQLLSAVGPAISQR